MIYFISDLHLAPQTPGATRIFLDFIGGRARAAEQLYILGDLFDAWAGDDCIADPDDDFNRRIVAALRALSDAGVGLAVMHGNRDFLLGEEFAAQAGAKLLPDPYVLSVPAWQFVLSHGDLLCTDDVDYQAFRAEVRGRAWREAFLSKTLVHRKAIIAALRAQSEQAKVEKRQELMDVNSGATDDFLRSHGYATLIHGHTHRPATRAHLVDGVEVGRWVLSDWHEERGECLCWDGQQLHREALH